MSGTPGPGTLRSVDESKKSPSMALTGSWIGVVATHRAFGGRATSGPFECGDRSTDQRQAERARWGDLDVAVVGVDAIFALSTGRVGVTRTASSAPTGTVVATTTATATTAPAVVATATTAATARTAVAITASRASLTLGRRTPDSPFPQFPFDVPPEPSVPEAPEVTAPPPPPPPVVLPAAPWPPAPP